MLSEQGSWWEGVSTCAAAMRWLRAVALLREARRTVGIGRASGLRVWGEAAWMCGCVRCLPVCRRGGCKCAQVGANAGGRGGGWVAIAEQ